MSSSLSSSLLHHSRQISVYFFSSFSNTFFTILLLGGLGKHPCVRIIQLIQKFTKIYNSQPQPILGDPGVTSRDVAIFLGESLLQGLKSPWELILTEPVPEVVECRPAHWTEKYFFCPISDEVQPGNSVAFLHEVVFFIDRLSCLARATGRLSWRVSTKPR